MKPLHYIIIGFLMGVVVGVAGLWIGLRSSASSLIFSTYPSPYDTVESTTEALVKSIDRHGWKSPMVRDLNASLEDYGHPLDRTIRKVELCQPEYASKVLSNNPEFAAIIPCSYAVYEGKDGGIYISGLNTEFIGKLLGGPTGKVVGSNVSVSEEWIISDLASGNQ